MIRKIRIRFRESGEESDFLDLYLWNDKWALILLQDFKILLPTTICSEAESEEQNMYLYLSIKLIYSMSLDSGIICDIFPLMHF